MKYIYAAIGFVGLLIYTVFTSGPLLEDKFVHYTNISMSLLILLATLFLKPQSKWRYSILLAIPLAMVLNDFSGKPGNSWVYVSGCALLYVSARRTELDKNKELTPSEAR